MLPTATIVFREFLEIALILGIILAATTGLKSRWIVLAVGLAIGVAGSLVIAFFTDAISEAIDGVGQEIFNAAVMFVAVGFLSWTVIWMKKHGRELAQTLKKVGEEVTQGTKPLYVLVVIIAISTFREGAEIALFTYGMSASGNFTTSEIALGGLLGAVGGTIVGIMLYMGLLKASQKHLFTVTSWMLILLTAGMAAQGAGYLIAADMLPAIIPQLWDTSSVISGDSLIGEILSVLIGYTPRPSAMEFIFYLSVISIVGAAYVLINRSKNPVATA